MTTRPTLTGARRHPGRRPDAPPHPYAGAVSRAAHRRPARRPGAAAAADPIPAPLPAPLDPDRPVSLGVGLSFPGLEALGVPAESLASFPSEFQQGMAARADYIGDVGESAPEHWEAPLGSQDVHVVVAALARDTSRMEALVGWRRTRCATCPASPRSGRWTRTCCRPSEPFGFKDSISQPAVEGTDILGSNPHEAPLKAGEFVLGYQDETGDVPPVPQAGGAGPQRHVRGLPQAAPAGGGLPPVPRARMPRTTPSRSGWRPSSSGAGPAARRSPWPRTRTTPNWAPTRSGTTPSCTATTRGVSSARSARTPGG